METEVVFDDEVAALETAGFSFEDTSLKEAVYSLKITPDDYAEHVIRKHGTFDPDRYYGQRTMVTFYRGQLANKNGGSKFINKVISSRRVELRDIIKNNPHKNKFHIVTGIAKGLAVIYPVEGGAIINKPKPAKYVDIIIGIDRVNQEIRLINMLAYHSKKDIVEL